jgi:hypothetical protein
MRLVVPGIGRAIGAAVALFNAFASAFASAARYFSPPALFGEQIRYGLANPPTGGRGDVLTALEAAVDGIIALQADFARRKRVVVIGGCRPKPEVDFDRLRVKLKQFSVVVDAFVLSPKPRAILPICALTGGLAFVPSSLREGLDVVRREEFVDLSLRRIAPRPAVISLEGVLTQAAVNIRIPRGPPLSQDAGVVADMAPLPVYREQRIARELSIVRLTLTIALAAP